MISTARHLPLLCILATLSLTPAVFAQGDSPANTPKQAAVSGQKAATQATDDRGNAYYHYMMAREYEEMATTMGRTEYANRAIEEYKMALNGDSSSPYLNSHLAELYFRTGRIKEAINAAQDRIKQDPNDLEAHKLLAEVYLRSLGNGQQDTSGQMLKLAIAEYQKIVQLEPNDP
ncbi:MAG TPA: tetratricopeptide repeat protein, partial [Acidobacteriaceae bacterium]|nr:tetratricopeptide repeat protein [Acidobacteriaceae bacterium]